MQDMFPKVATIALPFSKSRAKIPYREASDCLVSLLTDPRIQDEDYMFFDDDPFAAPPENITYISDLITGEGYLKTYQKYVTKPNQILLPVPIYIDGAVTGQFSSLPITALKIGLGLLNSKTRDKGWAWRELGFVPQVRQEKSRGRKIFQESQHMEADEVEVLDGEGGIVNHQEDNEDDDYPEDEDEDVKAQDFHTMLRTILKSFVELQKTGFIWDFVHKGKEYKNVEFIIYVPFVKCDTEEADLLCGKYLSRGQNVAHLCRYCHCPNALTDDPRARFHMKTQAAIKQLIDNRNETALKKISQQLIKNAFYDLRFHAANGRGIHGACPSEMLHAILLGIFKYMRDIFFEHMGKQSTLADDINGLAKLYGGFFTHQSDRDLPKTNFSNGIRKGKLMAKEYRGVLLIMAAVLRSTEGRSLLMKRRRFGNDNGLRDWTILVEMLLEWEAYLCQPRLLKKDVKRLGTKHRYLMYVMRNVAKRDKGMGLKVSHWVGANSVTSVPYSHSIPRYSSFMPSSTYVRTFFCMVFPWNTTLDQTNPITNPPNTQRNSPKGTRIPSIYRLQSD